jgi:hypothetical protein
MSDELLLRIQAEIGARCAELRPRVEEYQQLLSAAEALGLPTVGASPRAGKRAVRAAKPRKAPAVKKATAARKATAKAKAPRSSATARARRGAAQTAILAALEHGSHTVAELGVVTAMSGQNIRENLRRLLSTGTITRAKREGKAAYALASRSAL